LLFVATACGESTEPRTPIGPSLLITNTLTSEHVYVDWNDGLGGLIQSDSVGPGVPKRCIRLQPVVTDSARWIVRATQQQGVGPPLTSSVRSHWFHAGDVRAGEVFVGPAPSQFQSPTMVAWDSASAVAGPVAGVTREIPPHC